MFLLFYVSTRFYFLGQLQMKGKTVCFACLWTFWGLIGARKA